MHLPSQATEASHAPEALLQPLRTFPPPPGANAATVSVVAHDERLALRVVRLLPSTWTIRTAIGWDEIGLPVLDVGVAILAAPDLADPGFHGAYDVMRIWSPELPLVLCTELDPDNFRRILDFDFQDLYLLESERRELRHVVLDVQAEDCFVRLSRLVRQLVGLSPLCRRGLEFVCLQHPPGIEDATELAALGHIVYVRTVRQLAGRLRCSPAYLSRSAAKVGVQLGEFLRWVTFLRGLSLRTPGRRWGDIATRLGFNEPGAWTNFVRRLTGLTPSQAEGRHPDSWWESFLTTLGAHEE